MMNGAPGGGATMMGGQRYKMGAEIARGGMGRVRVAEDMALLRQIAVKELLDPHPDARQEFLEEARTTAQLEHPNIVPVHDLGTASEAGGVFLAMKRIHGRNLDEIYRDRKSSGSGRPHSPDDLRTILATFDKVCDALAFAHEKGVVHRDLKPANVMVGDFGEVLVMDWGIALVQPDSPLARTVDANRRDAPADEHAVVGTPAFMAPEQALGHIDETDARTDIFALGGLLYFMLTGRQPYSGRSLAEVLTAAAQHHLKSPRQVAPRRQIPKALSAIVMKAMARLPAARYATVGELQADLHAWQSLRSVSAYRPSVPERVSRWIRRRPTTAASLFLLVAFGLTTATVVAVLQGQLWQEKRGPRRKSGDQPTWPAMRRKSGSARHSLQRLRSRNA